MKQGRIFNKLKIPHRTALQYRSLLHSSIPITSHTLISHSLSRSQVLSISNLRPKLRPDISASCLTQSAFLAKTQLDSRFIHIHQVKMASSESQSDLNQAVKNMTISSKDGLSSVANGESSSTAEQNGTSESQYEPRYIDVGINLTDRMYQGFYHGKKAHEADLDRVILRAQSVGCKKLMVTGSSLSESKQAIQMAKEHPGFIFATVGVHPCCTQDLENHPEQLEEIEKIALEGKSQGFVTAFGEIGLDYDRFMLSPKEPQLRFFELQLRIAEKLDLPLFLHSRAAEEDFNRLLFAANLPRKGLVHSFTGTVEEMKTLVAEGYDIGVNGCSLKTQENLDVVKEIPLERLQIETDGPWCEIRPSHASAKYLKTMPKHLGDIPADRRKEKFELGLRVKSRNEPCAIAGVAWVIAQVKGCSFEEVCETSWNNSMKMFQFDDAAARQQKAQEEISA